MDNNGLGNTKQLYVYGIVENENKEVYIYFIKKSWLKQKTNMPCQSPEYHNHHGNCILIPIISFLRLDPNPRPQLLKKSLHKGGSQSKKCHGLNIHINLTSRRLLM